MAISFTPEQRQVIELHHCNILVSAAAGSGKTAVLVERIIEMVCDSDNPVDIDRLLIVTFTNAAAAEMRERIGQAIAERLRENPQSAHLQRQSALLHNALITTIDSFSLFLLRNHFNEIDLDPAFRVADEGEIKLLQRETLEELLEERFAGGSEAFKRCVETFCTGGHERALEQHILNLSEYASSFPWPKEWLQQRKQDYAAQTVEELLDENCSAYLERYLRQCVEGCVARFQEALRICEEPDGPYMYGGMMEQEWEQLEALSRCQNWREMSEKIQAVRFGRLPSTRDDSVDSRKREYAKELRGQVKATLQKLTERFFATPLTLALRQSQECAGPVEELISLTIDFDKKLQEKKREKKLIDFSDMEHYALDILIRKEDGELRPSAVALEYRQYFKEVLIDEYQDSNLVQEYLLKAVSGEEQGEYNRFMVGDVKQSIYKFRLARPELFLEKYALYGETGHCRRIDLSKNFRSREQVIETVNDIFGRIMSKECGGIDYDERAMLYVGVSYPQGELCESELILTEKPTGEAKWNAKQAEALAVAQRIQELLKNHRVTDKASGALRPVRYSDIVILLRTNKGWDEEFKAVLESKGIPVYIASKTGYFAATEVQELLNVLRVLHNPLQDISLFGMMKSVFGGFSEEEIAKIRSGQKKALLYDALKAYAGEAEEDRKRGNEEETEENENRNHGNEAVSEIEWDSWNAAGAEEEWAGGNVEEESLREKARAFLSRLKKYRESTVFLPIRDLLQRIVEENDYLSYVTALPGGSKRRANVEMLFTKASDFEKTSYFGLFHFIRYMEQLEKYDVDYGEADKLDENADVVRIMSIHKSKGLEFPVTFVSGLSKRFNTQDTKQALIADMDLGLATDYVNPESRIRNKTLRQQVIACKLKEDNLAEELRVLYVALTRAKEKLIMTAVLEEASEKIEELTACGIGKKERLQYLDFIEAGNYLDLLLPIITNTNTQISVKCLEQLAGEEVREQVQFAVRKEMLAHAAEYADKEQSERLGERFDRQYPYRFLEGLYTKTTVSELKIAAMSEKDEAAFHAFEEKEVVPYLPAFRRKEEAVSGAVRGNAYHKVMELLDFAELLGRQFATVPEEYQTYAQQLKEPLLAEDLEGFLKDLIKEMRLPEEYYPVIRLPKLVHFIKSELGWRMWRAQREGQLYREQPFVLGVEASRLKAEFPAKEQVLIQGIIDVFFVEDGELVLLDYKTDVIQNMEALWNRYDTQLCYYEEALRRLMGMPVKEKLLYSFYLERF